MGNGGFTYLPIIAPTGSKGHVPVERPGEDLVEIALRAGDHRAIRPDNADRRYVRVGTWGVDKRGGDVKQLRPIPGVFGARDLPVRVVHERVSAIPQ
jgi:hypothetical protein